MKTNFENYDTCIFILPSDTRIDEYMYEFDTYFDKIYIIDKYGSGITSPMSFIGLSKHLSDGTSFFSTLFTKDEFEKHLAGYDGFLVRIDKQERIDLSRPFSTIIYKSRVKEYINELEEQGEI